MDQCTNRDNIQFHKNKTDALLSGLPEHIMAQIREFRASNQFSNEVRDRMEEPTFNINHLRSDNDLREQVETGLGAIRSRIPSLAAAPTSRTQNHRSLAPDITPHYSEENIDRYEWKTDYNGKRYLVPISRQTHIVDDLQRTGNNQSTDYQYRAGGQPSFTDQS